MATSINLTEAQTSSISSPTHLAEARCIGSPRVSDGVEEAVGAVVVAVLVREVDAREGLQEILKKEWEGGYIEEGEGLQERARGVQQGVRRRAGTRGMLTCIRNR